MSPSTKKWLRLLVESAAPRDDWRKAFRLTLAQLRQDVDLHPAGGSAADVFGAAAHATRVVAAECLPLAMALVMHLYPLCALRCMPLPWWSPANLQRRRLLSAIDRRHLMLANAGSERVMGSQAPVIATLAEGGLWLDGTFDYVSLANVADLVLFAAPSADGAQVFCIAELGAPTAVIGAPKFSGTMKLSDTCPLTFKRHWLPSGSFVKIGGDQALDCVTHYQRSWFQLLAAEAHLARLEHLRRRWQLAHMPEDAAGRGELNLLRRFALRLLNEAAAPGAIDQLAEVTAAVKLRVSWKSQAMADALAGLDATSAAELRFLKRQPTSDDRILRGLESIDQPLEVHQPRFGHAGAGHAAKAAT